MKTEIELLTALQEKSTDMIEKAFEELSIEIRELIKRKIQNTCDKFDYENMNFCKEVGIETYEQRKSFFIGAIETVVDSDENFEDEFPSYMYNLNEVNFYKEILK